MLSPFAISLLAFCVLAEVGRELCFKCAADQARTDLWRRFVRNASRQPMLWLGVGLWAVEIVAWIVVLELAPLGIAYPIMTLSYAAVPVAGRLFLAESLSLTQATGAGLVALGVLGVGLSST